MTAISLEENLYIRTNTRDTLLDLVHESAHCMFFFVYGKNIPDYRREQEYFARRAEETYRQARGWPLEFGGDDKKLREAVDVLYKFTHLEHYTNHYEYNTALQGNGDDDDDR
jgi:hypothetical protein